MNTLEWPARPFLFAVLGALTAICLYLLTDDISPAVENFNLRIAIAAAMVTFSLSFAISARRNRLVLCVMYAFAVALIVAGLCYWRLFIHWLEPFGFMALGLSVFILTPFFQSSIQSSLIKFQSNYQALHHNAWGNTLVGGLSVLFMGLSFALAYLLAELFQLIGIDLLSDLLREKLSNWILGGTALGASIGVLREHDSIIVSTQSVVQSVFSILVTPLALGIGGFILLLPFTGLANLWNSEQFTSAILFACAGFALIVVNAVVRDNDNSQSKNRIAIISSRILALTIAPLTIISIMALKLRVDQYGWTPVRLWATVICAVLMIYGVAYLFSALNRQFPSIIRSVNWRLALAVAALALVLATPLLDFGAISTRSQLERLSTSEVTEDKLDLAAFAFDFGPSGREALSTLKENASPGLSARIDNALSEKSRWQVAQADSQSDYLSVKDKLTINPTDWTVTDKLLMEMSSAQACKDDGYCHLFVSESETQVLLLDRYCYDSNRCEPRLHRFDRLDDGGWMQQYPGELHKLMNDRSNPGQHLERLDTAIINGKVELRPVQRLQLFIDGESMGQSIE